MPCTVCERDFFYNRTRKRFERRTLNSLIRHTKLTLKEYFNKVGIAFIEGGFVCNDCYGNILKINSGERKLKRGFARLNHLGLTMSNSAILNNVDKIKSQFDGDLLKLKKGIEDEGMEDDTNMTAVDDTMENEDEEANFDLHVSESTVKRCLFPENEEERDDDNKVKGYTIVFDNVNQMTYASHTSKDQGNKIKNMVQASAAVDRVNCMSLNDKSPTLEDVENINLKEYLPSAADTEILRFEYTAAVGSILKDNMACFSTVKPVSVHEHEYMTESSTKSKLIPLGIMEKDECKLADMINIMEEYHKYVPSRAGKPVTTILYGDGLSCERANDAQLSRFNGEDDWARLRGLLPSIQEWHKRNILLADTYKLLYDVKSKKDVGTLSYVKNYFRHTNVKDNVHHSFNAATDMIRFTTTSYVLAKACEILNIENMEHVSQIPQVDQVTFDNIVQEITDMAFHPPNVENVFRTEGGNYCICNKETDGEWIMCDNAQCTGKWFHFECMGIDKGNVPKGLWFCSRICKNKHSLSSVNNNADQVFEYSKAVLWRGLGEIVRHNAVRNNDGEHMIIHWKEDMIEFFNNNHPKYFISGHKLLTNVNGGASERIKHQLTWNRTVNVKGGAGHNIEMDLQMEFLNKEYKEAVKNSKGNLSAATIARHGDMIGIKKTLGTIIDRNIACANTFTNAYGQFDPTADKLNFVNSLLKHKCLKFVGERFHKGFENFKINNDPQLPNGLRMRLKKHLKKHTVLLRNLTFM